MKTAYTKLFTDVGKQDKVLVGGKGFSLGLLTNFGINVPCGFVVTSDSYQVYLNHNRIKTLNAAAKQKILDGEFPDAMAVEIQQQLKNLGGQYFAVRSSSISEDSSDKSFAGMFESYLNVQPQDVLEAVKKCYISTLSERVLHYRNQEEAIAVVIQVMVDSQAAGVSFTKHPLTGEQDVVMIETCSGLGEPLVSGMITPDLYVADKQTGAILKKQKHTHQHKMIRQAGGNKTVPIDGTELKINPSHIRKLVACANKIEQFYNFACDIEWCIDDDTVYIVQSRPITVVAADAQSETIQQRAYSKRFSARILSPVFEEANVKGYWKYSQAQFELPFNLDGYHLYQPSVLHPKGEVDIWIHEELDKKLNQFIKKMIRRDLEYLARIEQRYLTLVDEFTQFSLTTEQQDFQGQSTAQQVEKLQAFDVLNQKMTSIYNAPIFILTALGEMLLEEMRVIDADKADSDFVILTLNCIQNPIWQRNLDLNKIHLTAHIKYGHQTWVDEIVEQAEIKILLQQYQRRWQFMGCTDVIGEAYDFAYFADLLKQQFSKNPCEEFARIDAQSKQEYQEFVRVAQKYKCLSYEITQMRQWLYHRNNTTEHYYRDFQYLKPLWLNISQRLNISYRNLLNLSVFEMIQGLNQEISALPIDAEARNVAGFTCEQQSNRVLLKTGVDDDERIEKELLGSDEMQGQIANKGWVEGKVKIIRDPVKEADDFNENDILVTSMTTPSFLPLMEKAAGIITDEGGILCHAALVSREIGKPCLIAVTNATQILKNNTHVQLDCNYGFVNILDTK